MNEIQTSKSTQILMQGYDALMWLCFVEAVLHVLKQAALVNGKGFCYGMKRKEGKCFPGLRFTSTRDVEIFEAGSRIARRRRVGGIRQLCTSKSQQITHVHLKRARLPLGQFRVESCGASMDGH